ncbi:TolC family outer membrane protein [Methylotuvimicrobium sp. KM2]|uniref:TolC family outer membrane protein n=1 Tax=Methylotuvimicrobium sp. KM2 TaxID=3133976 RepID=UPI00310146FC
MNKLKYGLLCLLTASAYNANAEDLLTIYRQALEADPQLRSAQLQVEIGSAQKGQALGQMLPQINGTANWSKNEQKIFAPGGAVNNSYPGTRYFLSLNQTLVDFAKFWDWRRASKVEDQYAAEAIEAQNELMHKVVERYFDWLQADDELDFARSEKQATKKQLEQVRKQYAKQMLKITDVYALEARLDQLEAEEIIAESNRVRAEESLRELTGVHPSRPHGLKDGIEFNKIEGDLQDWIAMAQSQNPQMMAKTIAIEAAENNVAVQKSKYMPVVDLQLNYYDTDTGFQSTRTPQIQTQVAAINVNVPLFSGGTTTHQLFEAQHRLEQSKNDNEATLRALIKETSDAFLSSNASVRHIKAAQKALESAVKSRESMERGLFYGVVTVSDLIQAQQSEYMSKRDLSIARYTYIKNRIRFLRSIGSINENNIFEINDWLDMAEAEQEVNASPMSISPHPQANDDKPSDAEPSRLDAPAQEMTQPAQDEPPMEWDDETMEKVLREIKNSRNMQDSKNRTQ